MRMVMMHADMFDKSCRTSMEVIDFIFRELCPLGAEVIIVGPSMAHEEKFDALMSRTFGHFSILYTKHIFTHVNSCLLRKPMMKYFSEEHGHDYTNMAYISRYARVMTKSIVVGTRKYADILADILAFYKIDTVSKKCHACSGEGEIVKYDACGCDDRCYTCQSCGGEGKTSHYCFKD